MLDSKHGVEEVTVARLCLITCEGQCTRSEVSEVVIGIGMIKVSAKFRSVSPSEPSSKIPPHLVSSVDCPQSGRSFCSS